MKRLLIVVVAIALGWTAVQRLRTKPAPQGSEDDTPLGTANAATDLAQQSAGSKFTCDGRVYCSQMTSCEEAKFFLAHCPGTRMDGDGDGIPCERQFCGSL